MHLGRDKVKNAYYTIGKPHEINKIARECYGRKQSLPLAPRQSKNGVSCVADPSGLIVLPEYGKLAFAHLLEAPE